MSILWTIRGYLSYYFGKQPQRVQARLVPEGNENAVLMHRLAAWCGGEVRVVNEAECGYNRYIFLPTPQGEEQATKGDYIVKHPTEGFQVVTPVKFI